MLNTASQLSLKQGCKEIIFQQSKPPSILFSFPFNLVQPCAASKHKDKERDIYSLLLKPSETLLPKKELTAGQCHSKWIKVPTCPQPCQQRSQELGSGVFFFPESLKGVIFALWEIFYCVTLNLTGLEITAGSQHFSFPLCWGKWNP